MSYTATPSVGAISTASNTPLTTARNRIQSIRWASKTPTAGDGCAVKDGSGNLIWQDFAPATTAYVSPPLIFNPPLVVDGYAVTQLDSGMVYIYLVNT